MKKNLFKSLMLAASLAASSSALAATDYCSSEGSNTNYEWIEAISLNGQVFTSGNNNGYYTHPETSVELQTTNNTMTLTPGMSNAGFVENWGVWLDADGDKIFSSNEQIFSYTGSDSSDLIFDLPTADAPSQTKLRVVMQYGSQPSPCGSYTYGETEDFNLTISGGEAPSYSHHITLDYDFTVHRNGQIGDDLGWVIEKDGQVVLQRNAAGELQYRYFNNLYGSDYRVWLQAFIDGSYQQVSNPVEYTPGITDLFELTLSSGYQLERSGNLGDSVQWVIEKDGQIVLQRNAANELNYTYFDNTQGGQFRVWLQQFINGEYRVVSNTVEYQVGQSQFNLSVDQHFEVTRNGQLGDQVQWVIEKDGQVVLQRNAADELAYTYYNNIEGSHYRVWLQKFINGSYQIVSNIVEYSVTPAPFSLSVDGQYQLSRSGQLGDSLQWVIEKDGQIALKRNAANELTYTYYSNTPGSSYRVWLEQFINGYYTVVSNTVEYTVQAEGGQYPYSLSVDGNYLLTRSGQLGDNLQWVIEKNGSVVLQRNAADELSYTYYSNTSGSTIKVHLQQFINGVYQQVSNSITYSIP